MAEPSDISSYATECLRDLALTSESQGIVENEIYPVPQITQSNYHRSMDNRSNSSPDIINSSSAPSTHIDLVNSARRPTFPVSNSNFRSSLNSNNGALPESVEAKMKSFLLSRQGTPNRPLMSAPLFPSSPNFPSSIISGSPADLRVPINQRPQPHNIVSAPIVPMMPNKGGLSARRGMKILGGLPGISNPSSPPTKMTLNNISDISKEERPPTMFNKFSEYVDTKNGTLKFDGKAVIHGHGIDFTSGSNFSISLDEVDTLEELGKGNYGTVYKVRHARPTVRRPGLGLAGCRVPSPASLINSVEKNSVTPEPLSRISNTTSGVVMAMKEIRLELDEAKFAAIIMELDILHRCNSPFIIDFYGAFFQEGAVYICIEYMDGGSIDKIYGNGIPENILRKITYATVKGLQTLKDDHNIIHRDVKPTNILINTRGQIKICDFGVSGNLVASIAKTNIGCQSYMAPERIAGGGLAQTGSGDGTYSVQSDIWSLGLTIIECALGRYPYPPETYNNIFSQLSAIVDGEPPALPKDSFSPQICDFVRSCLNKKPMLRPKYSMLLQHIWLAPFSMPETISEENEDIEVSGDRESSNFNDLTKGDKEVADWVINALEMKKIGKIDEIIKPALHAAPLNRFDGKSSPG
ncbi:putative map kinase kinase [Erysiphe necator]|uniref:mitogen-activated protein kinase kinase n=1 Tax=Uncinula necator TaxID=52586 RepID=A0A0B1PBA5_UNCNE|nr:putative map kinase kinase [Erysiphe necator]